MFGPSPESLSSFSHPRKEVSELLWWRSSGTSQLKCFLPHNLAQPFISKDLSGKFSWQSLQRLKSLSSSYWTGFSRDRKNQFSTVTGAKFHLLKFPGPNDEWEQIPGINTLMNNWTKCSLVSYQAGLKCCSLKDSMDRQQEHGQVKGQLDRNPKVTWLSRLAKCLWS